MNRYESTIPRAAIGIAAIVLTALTLAVSVILPAHLTVRQHDAATLAGSPKATVAAIHAVSLSPSQIDAGAACDHAQSAAQT